MTTDRALLERHIADIEVSEFSLERFHGRRRRRRRDRRVGAALLGVALLAVSIGGAIKANPDDRAITAAQQGPLSRFFGAWVSRDVGGSAQTMSIEGIDRDRVRMVIRRAAAPECSSSAATVTGTGELDGDGKLVAEAAMTCDGDASEGDAAPSTIEFTHDPTTGELFGLMVEWRRRPATTGEPTSVMAGPEFGALEPGTYFIDPDGDDATPLRVTFDVASDGWSSWTGAWKFVGESHIGFTITTVDNVVREACRDHRPAEPPVGPSVDDLATALTNLAPFEVSAPPVDVTVLGYQGKHLELTVPDIPVTGAGDDVKFIGCTDNVLHSWMSKNNEGAFYGYNGESGRTEQFWILDAAGTRLVLITTAPPDASPQDLAQLRAMLDSVRIQP